MLSGGQIQKRHVAERFLTGRIRAYVRAFIFFFEGNKLLRWVQKLSGQNLADSRAEHARGNTDWPQKQPYEWNQPKSSPQPRLLTGVIDLDGFAGGEVEFLHLLEIGKRAAKVERVPARCGRGVGYRSGAGGYRAGAQSQYLPIVQRLYLTQNDRAFGSNNGLLNPATIDGGAKGGVFVFEQNNVIRDKRHGSVVFADAGFINNERIVRRSPNRYDLGRRHVK